MSEMRYRKIISVQEFAEQTGVNETTVRRWLQEKQIKGTRIGRKWLIPIGELEKILNPGEPS